ncbi:MAG: AMP phosphorylase [Candidatus Diapherotrites archaeon]|nr:AMP phosphorylase [Candidatus Diapherotrites archaeon]
MKTAFKVKCVDLSTAGVRVVVLNREDARDLDLKAMDRVELSTDGRQPVTCIVDLTDTFVPPGIVGLFKEAYTRGGLSDRDQVYITPKGKPTSLRYIKEKMAGKPHTEEEINGIIHDLMNEELSDVELTGWISSIYIRGLEKEETIALTKAIVASGTTLDLREKRVFDKHCIGGVAGNRTTMIVVPIIAAAGLTCPKTSSRAITSPAGTADTMEVLAPVNLNKDDIEEVVNKIGACIVWGGAVNLAAADDKLIRIRHPLSLDPRGMLLASIMAKKKAVGATDVIIDIPVGVGAKIKSPDEATILAKQFNALGASLGMNIHSLLTNGDHPIGLAVGPTIEARETLRILNGENVSPELIEKSVQLAGVLLEIGEKAAQGQGREMALNLIRSGKAGEKFRKMIEQQGGDGSIKVESIPIGEYDHTVVAQREGRIEQVNNRGISAVVRNAGAPRDKVAGMYLHVEEGDRVKKGQPLFTVYAKSERKIEQALEAYKQHEPIKFARIILQTLD